jgi:hypothetical protein
MMTDSGSKEERQYKTFFRDQYMKILFACRSSDEQENEIVSCL